MRRSEVRNYQSTHLVPTMRTIPSSRPTYSSAVWESFKTAGFNTGTLTFTISQVIAGAMIARIGSSIEEQELYDNFNTLMSTSLYTLVIMAVSFSYSISSLVNDHDKKIEMLKNSAVEDGEKQIRISGHQIRVGRTFKSGIIINSLASVLPMVCMYYSGFILHNWFNQAADSSALAQIFFREYFVAILFVSWTVCLEQIYFALNEEKAACLMGLTSFALGNIAAGLLCFQFNLGIAGIARAYLGMPILSCIMYGLYLAFKPRTKVYPLFGPPCLPRMKDICQVFLTGLPIWLTFVAEVTTSLAYTQFFGWLGRVPLAAQNMSSQLMFFAMIPIIAFTQAVTPKVSGAFTEKNYYDVRRHGYSGLIAAVLALTILSSPFIIYPHLAGYCYGTISNTAVMAINENLLRITAVGVVADAAVNTLSGALRGLGHFNSTALISNLCSFLGLGFSATAYSLGLGPNLIAAGYTGGKVLGALILVMRWNFLSKSENLRNAPTLKTNVVLRKFGWEPSRSQLWSSQSLQEPSSPLERPVTFSDGAQTYSPPTQPQQRSITDLNAVVAYTERSRSHQMQAMSFG